MSRAVLHLVIVAALAGSVADARAQNASAVNPADERTMTELVDEYLGLYEPGHLTTARELEVLRKLFDNGPDFYIVTDGVGLTWPQREARIHARDPKSGAASDREGVHKTVEQRLLPLGPDAVVLTRMYRYEFTDGTGRKGHQDGAVTLTFARRGGRWIVVQYHGSHRPRMFDDGTPPVR